jgi:hypothetical protein
VIARQGRGRAAPAGGIEHYGHGHGISSQSHSGQMPRLYQPRRAAATTRQEGAPASPWQSTSQRSIGKAPQARPTQQRGRFAAGRLLLPASGSSSSIPMISLELAGTNLNRPTTTVTRRLTIKG